jgi:hypothetical protein
VKKPLEKNSIMKYNERVSGGRNEITDFVDRNSAAVCGK